MHYRKVYCFALHLTRNAPDAEDLTQHTFYRLAVNLRGLKNESKAKSWLYSTLYRKFIDQKRRVVKFPSVSFEEADAPQDAESPVKNHKLDHSAVRDAMMNLEEHLRVPISLFYLENYSYKEIARFLEIPIGTVMSRLFRAKTELHDRLTRCDRQNETGVVPS